MEFYWAARASLRRRVLDVSEMRSPTGRGDAFRARSSSAMVILREHCLTSSTPPYDETCSYSTARAALAAPPTPAPRVLVLRNLAAYVVRPPRGLTPRGTPASGWRTICDWVSRGSRGGRLGTFSARLFACRRVARSRQPSVHASAGGERRHMRPSPTRSVEPHKLAICRRSTRGGK